MKMHVHHGQALGQSFWTMLNGNSTGSTDYMCASRPSKRDIKKETIKLNRATDATVRVSTWLCYINVRKAPKEVAIR